MFKYPKTSWLAGLLSFIVLTPARSPAAEKISPPDPLFFVSARGLDQMREQLGQSPLGKMWAEPTLEPFKQACRSTLEMLRAQIRARGAEAVQYLSETDAVLEMVQQAYHDIRDSSIAVYLDPIDLEPESLDPKLRMLVSLGGETLSRARRFCSTPSSSGACWSKSNRP